jgi:hypothetical protein
MAKPRTGQPPLEFRLGRPHHTLNIQHRQIIKKRLHFDIGRTVVAAEEDEELAEEDAAAFLALVGWGALNTAGLDPEVGLGDEDVVVGEDLGGAAAAVD